MQIREGGRRVSLAAGGWSCFGNTAVSLQVSWVRGSDRQYSLAKKLKAVTYGFHVCGSWWGTKGYTWLVTSRRPRPLIELGEGAEGVARLEGRVMGSMGGSMGGDLMTKLTLISE